MIRLRVIPAALTGYRRLTPYLRAQRRPLIAVIVLTVATPLTTALAPLPMKVLVDYALAPTGSPDTSILRHVRLPHSPAALIALAAGLSLTLYLLASALDA